MTLAEIFAVALDCRATGDPRFAEVLAQAGDAAAWFDVLHPRPDAPLAIEDENEHLFRTLADTMRLLTSQALTMPDAVIGEQLERWARTFGLDLSGEDLTREAVLAALR